MPNCCGNEICPYLHLTPETVDGMIAARVTALELQIDGLQKQYLLVSKQRDEFLQKHSDALLQVDDLKAALALLKSELKERGERIDSANRLLSEEQKKADGLLAHLGALRAVLIIDGGEKLAPEIRKALWLDHDVALDLQRVRREVVEAAKELKTKERWPYLDVGGGRLAHALDALEKVEAARVETGLPLETRIIEKQETEKRIHEMDCGCGMPNGLTHEASCDFKKQQDMLRQKCGCPGPVGTHFTNCCERTKGLDH